MKNNYKYNKRKKEIHKYLRIIRLKRTVSYRVISYLMTTTIGWLVTGDPFVGLSIGAADALIKLILYYFHETWWERITTKGIKKIKNKNKNGKFKKYNKR